MPHSLSGLPLEPRVGSLENTVYGDRHDPDRRPGLVSEVRDLKDQMIPDMAVKFDRMQRSVAVAVKLLWAVAVSLCTGVLGGLILGAVRAFK